METKELFVVYKALFDTWRFQVNSHWQRSSFFSAFETVALAGCWKLFTDKSDARSAYLSFWLAFLGIALTLAWYLMNSRTHEYALYWLDAVGSIEDKIMERSGELGVDFAKKILDDNRSTVKRSLISHRFLERAVPVLFLIAWIVLLLVGSSHLPVIGCVAMYGADHFASPIVDAIPAWLQALAALCLVVLTAWTLIVLRRYATDTRQIARSGIEQTENAQRPFLALTLREPPAINRAPLGWGLENQGVGPALNIRHSEPGGNEGWIENIDPIKGSDFKLVMGFDNGVMQNHPFIIEYESLSGEKYQTVVEWQDGIKRTRFSKRV